MFPEGKLWSCSPEQAEAVGYFVINFGHLEWSMKEVRNFLAEIDHLQGSARYGQRTTFGQAWAQIMRLYRTVIPEHAEAVDHLDASVASLNQFRKRLIHNALLPGVYGEKFIEKVHGTEFHNRTEPPGFSNHITVADVRANADAIRVVFDELRAVNQLVVEKRRGE